VKVEELGSVDAATVAALQRLIPQLSTSAPPVTAEILSAVLENPTTTVLVARDGERIVGTLTLVMFPVPTGLRAWIEDVVVDESVRGQGVGDLLTTAALEKARHAGARSVDLTSRPSREAAHRLYERVGFVVRETKVYRYSFDPQ